ncbi:MAG: glutathione S-transferase family protein [Gammaproteobacteria bacterium]|nr:glutathione S-transferase family protein [Gammaproteobacteria bacterium]
MSAQLTFYTNPRSRGRIARWMLEEVGQPYETVILEYGGSMKEPEYMSINPMGKVPSIRHGEVRVTECAAICAYLADAFPKAGLAPPLEDRGTYYRWLFFAAGPVEAATTNRSLGFELTSEQESMAGYGNYGRVLATLEGIFAAGPYIAGDSFTAADVYVGSQVMWGMSFGSIERRPVFEDYVRRVQKREAYVRAQELDGSMGSG